MKQILKLFVSSLIIMVAKIFAIFGLAFELTGLKPHERYGDRYNLQDLYNKLFQGEDYNDSIMLSSDQGQILMAHGSSDGLIGMGPLGSIDIDILPQFLPRGSGKWTLISCYNALRKNTSDEKRKVYVEICPHTQSFTGPTTLIMVDDNKGIVCSSRILSILKTLYHKF